MTGAEIVVTAAGGVLIAVLAWFFFAPKQARRAEVRGGLQEVEVTVKGGYPPNLIRVREGCRCGSFCSHPCHQAFVADPSAYRSPVQTRTRRHGPVRRWVVWLSAAIGVVALLAGCSSAAPGGGGAGMGNGGGTTHAGGPNGSGMGPGMMGGGNGTPSAATSEPPNAQHVQLAVNPQPLGGVRNPAGAVVDGFVPATFRMRVGVPVAVTVLNYDDVPHTWTSQALGVDAAIPAGTARSPSTTTFVINPRAAGTFAWRCTTPCDAWAMAHDGYMRGTVTVAG